MAYKLIFLDFDGVLNSSLSREIKNEIYHDNGLIWHYINQHNLDVLRLATEKTGASLVISSTWKKDSYVVGEDKSETNVIHCFKAIFENHGWPNAPIIGSTPNLSGFRGEEVAVFLDEFSKTHIIEDYLILDDGSDFFYDITLLKEYHLDKYGFNIHPQGTRPYWENQRLIQVNPLTGLNYEHLIDILKIWIPSDDIVQEYDAYKPYLQNYTKKFK
jgi:hypothetical protein